MVSLLNDFACMLLGLYYFHNIYHILCTCVYLYEYSYGYVSRSEMKNTSHIIGYKETTDMHHVFSHELLVLVLM